MNVANALANLVSNITVQSYSSASGSLTLWFTSTKPSSNPGGSQYPAWMYPDHKGGAFPGYKNGSAAVCGTGSTAPPTVNGPWSWTGLGSGGVYIGVAYNMVADEFSVVYGPSGSQPTDAQIAQTNGDGSLVVVITAATSGSVIATGGGGGSSFSGGGGHQVNKY